jgi:hypothetical protein
VRLVLCLLLFLPGCRLGELLNPGPPPKETVCERVWTIRVIQEQDADTTYIQRRQVVPCEDETP